MKKYILMITLILAGAANAQVVSPPNQSTITSTQPTISADFDTRVSGARMWVDGKEFTQNLRTNGDTVTLVPPYNLDYGIHQVQVATNNGRQTNWSFAIANGNNNQAYRNGRYRNGGYNNNQTYYPSNQPYNNQTYNNPNYNNPNYNPNNGQTYYPNGQTYYPTNNDPYYTNNNQNQTYYPVDPNYNPNNNNTQGLGDILPALLPQLFPNR